MPKRIEFTGHSDDTFGWDLFDPDEKRVGGDSHDDCANGRVRAFLVDSKHLETRGRVAVIGAYGKTLKGTWSIGMGLIDEDDPWPPWARQPVWSARGYTPVLSLLVPDDATVTLLAVDGDAVDGERRP